MTTKMFFWLFILLIQQCFTNAKTLKWATNPYLIPPMSGSPTQYLVFHGQLALNQTLSRRRCEAMGGDLADIDDLTTFNYLHTRLHNAAFIASFLGERYRETCIALYPGGAVAIPESGCARLGSICEVPVFGTHGLDLRSISIPADPKAPIGIYSNATIISDDSPMHTFQNNFIKTRLQTVEGEKKENRAIAKVVNSVTTVTIYGSIETDPALPCCKCCNPI